MNLTSNLGVVSLHRELLKNNLEAEILSAKRISVKTDRNRIEVLSEIAAIVAGKVNSTPLPFSSLGCVEKSGFKVFVKPKNFNAGGLDNEDFLYDKIQSFLDRPEPSKWIIFHDDRRQFHIKVIFNKTNYKVGTDTKNRKKADLVVGGIPLSIKKDSANYWESSDSYTKTKAASVLREAINSGKITTTTDEHGCVILSNNVAWKATDEEVMGVVFGSDIKENDGAVITKTFQEDDFEIIGDTIYIKVNKIITELEEVNTDVWFVIRGDRTRKTIPGFQGLRCLAAKARRVSERTVIV